jgi:hypothetical protein
MTPEFVRLNYDQVRACFRGTDCQGEVMTRLYRLVYPDWDEIASIDDHPLCNQTTWKAICAMWQAFDREVINPKLAKEDPCHTGVLLGGAWLNSGFSGSGHHLADWWVQKSPVTYKPSGERQEALLEAK